MERLLWAKGPLAIPVFQVLQTGRLGQGGAEWELLPGAGALVLHEDHTASLPGVSSWEAPDALAGSREMPSVRGTYS